MISADIVIIDSGVDRATANLEKVVGGCSVISGTVSLDKFEDAVGHGTAIASLFMRLLPEANLFIIKVFHENKKVTTDDIITALEYISDHVECGVVNLSFGVRACTDVNRLYNACEKVASRGTILVAAFDNMGAVSYPAAFDNVIGVDYTYGITSYKEFEFVENSIVNIRGTIKEQWIPWLNGKRTLLQGSSFLAPHISAFVFQDVNSDTSLRHALNRLRQRAAHVVEVKKQTAIPQIFPIRKAICFPYNKEMHGVSRYASLLTFQVSGYFDSRYSGRVGSLVNGVDASVAIQNYKVIDWDADFDTLILGHTNEMAAALGTDVALELLSECIRHKKSVVCFDNIHLTAEVEALFEAEGLSTYCPTITPEHINYSTFGKLYSLAAPVLSIFGTSMRQGKFSLQLTLRDLFTSQGYDVGQLGTEPTSSLFGLDRCYPMGYNSFDEMTSQQRILIINKMLADIDSKGPDIIITGAQSHTIPPSTTNVSGIPTSQQDIIFAAKPDCCILCVNASDDVQYVNRTIKYIEALSNAEVIALVLSPVHGVAKWTILGGSSEGNTQLVDSEIRSATKALQEGTNKPIYAFDDEPLQKLYDAIIDYLSED